MINDYTNWSIFGDEKNILDPNLPKKDANFPKKDGVDSEFSVKPPFSTAETTKHWFEFHKWSRIAEEHDRDDFGSEIARSEEKSENLGSGDQKYELEPNFTPFTYRWCNFLVK